MGEQVKSALLSGVDISAIVCNAGKKNVMKRLKPADKCRVTGLKDDFMSTLISVFMQDPQRDSAYAFLHFQKNL